MTAISFISAMPYRPFAVNPARSSRPALCMLKSSKRNEKRSAKRDRPPKAGDTPTKANDVPPTPHVAPSGDSEMEDRERLRRDVEAFKARAKAKAESEPEPTTGAYSIIKDVFDKVLVFDFFLVIALLGWLVVALVPHFAFKNDTLLDPWLALWQPVIQPLLGVLMLGTLSVGMVSYMFDTSK